MKKILDEKKGELIALIEKIKIKHGWTQGQIAEQAGYTPNYLSEALSKNIISKKLLRTLQGLLEREGTDTINTNDAGKIFIQNQERIIASQRVILSILAEIQAPQTKQLPTQLLSIYRSMVEDEEKVVHKEMMLRS